MAARKVALGGAMGWGVEALFISHRRGLGQALTPSSAWQTVKRVARLLGLKGLTSPHMFRYYLAEDMLRSGTPLESVP